MNFFYSSPEPFEVRRDGSLCIAENRYLRCVHDSACGGGIAEAVVKNGSGVNLFARPQTTVAAVIENGAYRCFRPTRAESSISQSGRNPVLEFRCGMADDSGKLLEGLTMRTRVEYTPWGEARFRLSLNASRRIENLGMVQIGTLFPAARMDTLAVQEAGVQSPDPYSSNPVKRWLKLRHENLPAYLSRWLPVSVLAMKAGEDGFQYTLGDNLAQWDSIGGTLPGFQMGYFAWNSACGSYEMRFSALDCRRPGQFLEGENVFEFSLAFPFVREKNVPFFPCSGNIMPIHRGFEHRWPEESDLTRLENAGASLMTIHNDGNTLNDGIFWRDAAYPPYPPEEMAKMDDTLRRASAHGIRVVPYFSLHEYHPDAAGFAEHAEEWGRIAAPGDGIIPSHGPNGLYGYQMCLESGWFQKRIDTIDEVLSRHRFSGVYYDWCGGLECLNPAHGPRHSDFRKLLDLLEWSRERIGKEGALYLHMTHKPNIAAENMATLVLTEECGGAEIGPGMFTPHAHFMNIVPRQVCCMLPRGASAADHRRYALCALLHHATVAIPDLSQVHTDFYAGCRGVLNAAAEYSRNAAPGEGTAEVSNSRTGICACWNPGGNAMLILVNLSERAETTDYLFRAGTSEFSGKESIPPLSLKTVNLNSDH